MPATSALATMGLTIEPHREFDNGYRVHAVRSGDLVFVSGQVSDAEHDPVKGVVGRSVTVEEARRGARLCAINTLRALVSLGLSVDDVTRVVKVLGMVNAVDGFADSALVIHGASSFYREVFGAEVGAHARSAVVMGLPKGFAVEVEAIFEVASAPALGA